MIIHYSNNKMEKILTDRRLLKKYHSDDYENILNRLSELALANNLNEIPEIPPPKRHKLTGPFQGYKDCWGIKYSKNDRIIIHPIGKYNVNDLKSIVEILIVALKDYH